MLAAGAIGGFLQWPKEKQRSGSYPTLPHDSKTYELVESRVFLTNTSASECTQVYVDDSLANESNSS